MFYYILTKLVRLLIKRWCSLMLSIIWTQSLFAKQIVCHYLTIIRSGETGFQYRKCVSVHIRTHIISQHIGYLYTSHTSLIKLPRQFLIIARVEWLFCWFSNSRLAKVVVVSSYEAANFQWVCVCVTRAKHTLSTH